MKARDGVRAEKAASYIQVAELRWSVKSDSPVLFWLPGSLFYLTPCSPPQLALTGRTIEDHLRACVMWAGVGALETWAEEKRGESFTDLCVYGF
ncbi:hypothetical protein E5288_WYG002002 [Bos mutus]|uniref:Uncharacterized protein n=1 Tax=Bos mutus TaxID=72004 RepID=A0A6B0RQH9_9CETA|nr:hypothetical protein [Bos mutus]